MLQVSILSVQSKGGNLHGLLQPLLQKLEFLQRSGINLIADDGKQYNVHAYLLLASGDIPGVASLINHSGHHSTYGCRICLIKSTSAISPKGKGYGQYFPGPIYLDEIRPAISFREGDVVSINIKRSMTRALSHAFRHTASRNRHLSRCWIHFTESPFSAWMKCTRWSTT